MSILKCVKYDNHIWLSCRILLLASSWLMSVEFNTWGQTTSKTCTECAIATEYYIRTQSHAKWFLVVGIEMTFLLLAVLWYKDSSWQVVVQQASIQERWLCSKSVGSAAWGVQILGNMFTKNGGGAGCVCVSKFSKGPDNIPTQWVRFAILVWDREDSNDGVAVLPQLLVNLLAEQTLTDHCDLHLHNSPLLQRK